MNLDETDDFSLFPSYFLQTIVVIDLFCACHNENIFKDPSEFRPERWMRENKDEQHAFANLQFGYGVRMCLGKKIRSLFI